jgi:hypothetical protein
VHAVLAVAVVVMYFASPSGEGDSLLCHINPMRGWNPVLEQQAPARAATLCLLPYLCTGVPHAACVAAGQVPWCRSAAAGLCTG